MKTTDFGFDQIPVHEKKHKVGEVFSSVAESYDVMNDLMSFGIHRFWKAFTVAYCKLRPGHCVLDLAGGSGDLSARLVSEVGDRGRVILADINRDMIKVGQRRLLDKGLFQQIEYVQADAENLPFSDHFFDRVVIGFGLRNVTHKENALASIYRVLKPGGKLLILEFSQPIIPILKPIYDAYSFKILPLLGQWIANDADSYRYLAESIRMHPDQETLKNMVLAAGFDQCDYHNFTGGIVALHQGIKY